MKEFARIFWWGLFFSNLVSLIPILTKVTVQVVTDGRAQHPWEVTIIGFMGLVLGFVFANATKGRS